MRFRVGLAAMACAAASFTVGCGGGASARLEIELAPAPGPGEPEAACLENDATLPSDVDCVSVRVCRREAPDRCVAVPLVRPGDDHAGSGATELRFSRTVSPTITFDVGFEAGATYELELVAYRGEGTPYARGVATGIVAGTRSVRVRLEPFGQWSCAGPSADGRAPAARALHAAVPLPNGDVLIVGGVTGTGIAAAAVESGAPLERTIEVYDVSEGRFYRVEGAVDVDGVEGYGAVFHRASFLGETEDGRYRVRSVGGFTANGDDPAARFDAIQGLTHFSAPLLPAARSNVRDSVDILYDPSSRTATIRSVEPGRVPRGGFDAVSEPDAEGLVVVVVGLENGGGTAFRPVPELSGTWYALPAEGFGDAMSQMLLAPRFGATASRLAAGQVLVWGGNVNEASGTDVAMRAGEILGAMAGAVPGGVGGLPPSTALHTATAISGGVLIAGGVMVSPVAGMSGGMSTTPSTQPLTVLASSATMRVVGTPVDPAGWPSPILHAAVGMPDGSVVLAGGAVRMNGAMPGGHLWPISSVIRVRRDPTGVYAVLPLPALVVARWGHAMTTLPGGRLLVTGGFQREGSTLRAISTAEVLVLPDEAPPPLTACEDRGSVDAGAAGPPGDAGASRDADATAPVDGG